MSADRRLGVSVLAGGGTTLVVAAGELDLETAPLLADALTDSARTSRRVTLDLAAITFLDAPAVARVWAAVDTLRGRLAVVPPHRDSAAMRFLQLARLDDRLPAAT
jgi:anti-anti-sigma factor